MKSVQKQQGKVLMTFLAGSVVSLIAIAAMLFMLNNNSEKVFKQPELANNRPNQPEVLRPDMMSSQPQNVVAPVQTASATPSLGTNTSTIASATATPAVASQAAAPVVKPVAVPTEKTATDVKPIQTDVVEADKPPVAAAKSPKQPQNVPEKPKQVVKTEPVLTDEEIKPTAQQIMDSGSLEAAQELARKEALAKRSQPQKNVQAQKTKTQGPEKSAANAPQPRQDTAAKAPKGGTANVQAGAFGNRGAAESQRAKLALMGVQTEVVTVESGGKKLYRVQTGKISADKAREVQNNLKEQGVDTYTNQR